MIFPESSIIRTEAEKYFIMNCELLRSHPYFSMVNDSHATAVQIFDLGNGDHEIMN